MSFPIAMKTSVMALLVFCFVFVFAVKKEKENRNLREKSHGQLEFPY